MKTNFTKIALSVLAGLTLFSTTTLSAKTTKVDTLFLYSQGASDLYNGDIETKINHLVATTNKIYKDSGLDLELNVVKMQKYSMDDSAQSATVLQRIQQDSNVAKIRDSVGADEVVIYRPYANDGYCGLAYRNDYLRDPNATWVERYAFAHVTIDCGAYATAHEVGHNMGLGHSARQNSTGAYSYARGHGVDGDFVTVMAYESSYGASKIYKFSSPTLDCNGKPCGVPEGERDEANAVKALKLTTPLVENFREHVGGESSTTTTTDTKNQRDTATTTNDRAKKLEDAKKAYEAQKQKVTDIKKKLQTQKELFLEKKEEYKQKRAAYKEAIAQYRKARSDYRARKISKEAFLAKRNDLMKERDLLRAYINNELKPAYNSYKDTYYKEYKPAVQKLRELRKTYLDLKRGA